MKDVFNLKTFFALLPIVATEEYGWHVSLYKCIRSRNRECPICAILNEIEGSTVAYYRALEALDSLGIARNTKDCQIIMEAADHKNLLEDNPNAAVRARILQILNPEEN